MINVLNKKGFTLIEVMIAVTLFSVIMVIGTGAVLNSNVSFRKTESLRTIIDNLHFIMEDMSRTLRTGNLYGCGGGNIASESSLLATNCSSNTDSIAFLASDSTPDPSDNDFVVYGFDQSNKTIVKKTKDNLPGSFLTMTAPGIVIDTANSGFIVVGAGQDGQQSRVLIHLTGTITDPRQNIVTPFNIQTTVSQRSLDS